MYHILHKTYKIEFKNIFLFEYFRILLKKITRKDFKRRVGYNTNKKSIEFLYSNIIMELLMLIISVTLYDTHKELSKLILLFIVTVCYYAYEY